MISDHVVVPDHVDVLLRRACYDCHSDQTRWPWYARLSPISWFLVRDVEHGLSNLDFSHWSTDPVIEPTPTQRLNWMCRDIEEGIMPPKLYLRMHPSAKFTAEQQEAFCAWTTVAVRQVAGGR